VAVTLNDCSQAEEATIISSPTYCVVCEASDAITFTADAAVTNPVFRLYTSQDATTPFFTGSTYEVSQSELPINLALNKQGGYKKFYVSVSGSNYAENLINTRKEITVSGAALPVFAAYNLGADPSLDTPKKQMNYLATHAFNDVDGHVYGGRFQWGRVWDNIPANNNSYQISVDGNYTLYKGNGAANKSAAYTANAFYNATTGQIEKYDATNSATGLHIYNTSSPYDWSIPQNDNLWGNGKPVETSMAGTQGASTGVLKSDGNWYQSPVPVSEYANNNPCPSGWRVPTQDEWERIGSYDCNPASAGGSFSTSVSGGVTGKGFTWVPVVCASGSCTPNATWSSSTNSGYAVYRTSDWATYTSGNLLNFAKEPFLFLPSAGFRASDSGPLGDVGASGFYWSSSPAIMYARDLFFNSSSVTPSNSGASRAGGISVRCVSE
jgi:uncharacterized protein (TIGR02145 family)